MIERFDSFLIDRGFQPISDRLAWWASCYAIAGFLITGATLAEIAALLRLEAWAALVIVAPWFAFQAWRAHRMESAPASNVLPKERIVSRFTRVFYIALSITNAPVTVADDEPYCPPEIRAANARKVAAARMVDPIKREIWRIQRAVACLKRDGYLTEEARQLFRAIARQYPHLFRTWLDL